MLLKKGFINPLRETTVPVIIELNKQDPLYMEKCALVMNKW